ncbi:uncharacterized protein [Eurosta solidaginis]|uniref:uncharacterized protein n=1 Tax=Eurosta solidaginis TaxID=178769 RepID=UPI0035311C1A
MKLGTTLFLLLASACCFLKGCEADSKLIPSSVIDEAPITIEKEETVNVVEQPEEIFESEIKEVKDEYVKPLAVEPRALEARAIGCKVSIRGGLPQRQPIYIQTNSSEFYPYDASGNMVFDAGEEFDLHCPKAFSSISKSLITASCVSGTNFKVDGTTYSFKELTCTSWPAFIAEKTGDTCEGGIAVRVGFKVSSSRFIEQYNLCFNEDEEVTRYVHHTLIPGGNFYETGVERLTFGTGDLFNGKKVDNLYKTARQIATINADLGGDADKYFQANKNIFLSRGHMAAKADFTYANQQRATFLFVNIAPQWQVFNAGNWAKVEDGVRAKVTKAGWYVDCYTGVYGVTTLPNIDGVETPLYLSRDANNNGLIPVPMLYFRVVIERTSQKGIVFVGVNNPHLTLEQIQADYILCTDVSDRVNYINWKPTDIMAGYSYACEVSDFKSQVENLPELSAPGGLLL